MDSALKYSLIQEQPRGSKRRVVVVLAACTGGLALASYGAFATSKPRNSSTGLAAFPGGNSTECWQMTGGTCRFLGCNAERGPTTCYQELGKGYNCVCQEGYCSGPDGHCYEAKNELIASGVTLSATLSGEEYYLLAENCDQSWAKAGIWRTPTKVGKDGTGLDAKWSIWRLPGKAKDYYWKDGRKNPSYMLVPEKFPNCVVSEYYDNSNFRNPLASPFQLTNTWGPWHWGTSGSAGNYGPDVHSFFFEKLDNGKYHLTLADSTGLELYVSSTSSVASLWANGFGTHAGSGGEWTFTPPLPADLGEEN